MNKKYGLTVIIVICLALFGFSGQSDVLACHVNCPENVEPLPDPVEDEYTFTYVLDPCTYRWHKNVSIQMDVNIPCYPSRDEDQPCSNIDVLLNDHETPYSVLRRREVKESCNNSGEIRFFNAGPRPFYFIEAEIQDGQQGAEVKYSFDCNKESTPSYYPKLEVVVRTDKTLEWSNNGGNVVVTNTQDNCKVCNRKVPAVAAELTTFRQFINLKPGCRVGYRFDAEGNLLPARRRDLVGPGCEGVEILGEKKPIQNNRIQLRILPEINGDLKNDAMGDGRTFTLNFVKATNTNSVDTSFKTGEGTEYWFYVPGIGWQVFIF